jgi:quercetin dioxygenase-like cupin family protein
VGVKDLSRTLVARFTVQPGAQFPWHSHAGPVVVNVTKGELIHVDGEDCVERPYAPGTAFVDAGHGHTHTAFNATSEETVIVATFYEAPPQGPLHIPAQAPSGCNL